MQALSPNGFQRQLQSAALTLDSLNFGISGVLTSCQAFINISKNPFLVPPCAFIHIETFNCAGFYYVGETTTSDTGLLLPIDFTSFVDPQSNFVLSSSFRSFLTMSSRHMDSRPRHKDTDDESYSDDTYFESGNDFDDTDTTDNEGTPVDMLSQLNLSLEELASRRALETQPSEDLPFEFDRSSDFADSEPQAHDSTPGTPAEKNIYWKRGDSYQFYVLASVFCKFRRQ